jgi:hypothetical protein
MEAEFWNPIGPRRGSRYREDPHRRGQLTTPHVACTAQHQLADARRC